MEGVDSSFVRFCFAWDKLIAITVPCMKYVESRSVVARARQRDNILRPGVSVRHVNAKVGVRSETKSSLLRATDLRHNVSSTPPLVVFDKRKSRKCLSAVWNESVCLPFGHEVVYIARCRRGAAETEELLADVDVVVRLAVPFKRLTLAIDEHCGA